jgi:hypothetical protein
MIERLSMKRSVLFWILAAVITIGMSLYQRLTGPTYPLGGTVTIGGKDISFRLDRSHAGEENAPITIRTDDESITGILEWRTFESGDEFIRIPMAYENGTLKGELPHQLPMEKLEYRIVLQKGEETLSVPAETPLMIRFKGEVPLIVLVPHVILMLASLLLAARTGLEAFSAEPRFETLLYWTLGVLFAGGFILGPLATQYAFGLWWTGWPVGSDITDNKTTVAMIAWIVAWVAFKRAKNPKPWVLGAAVVMMIVFLIPHSIIRL